MNMKMKYLVLVFSALAFGTTSVGGQPTSAPAAAAATNAVGAKIKFATPLHDFGRAKAGDLVKYTYIFTNAGDQLLILTNVQPQCGCTTAGEWTRQVEPGKTGYIPIQFNSANYNGPVFKQVTVTCNNQGQPTMVLQLKGTVYKPFEINPPYPVLNIPPDAETASVVVNITNNTEEALSLSGPEINNHAFAAELKTIESGKGYQLIISVVPPLKPGITPGQISLKTSWTNPPVLTVSVSANVQPAIDVKPPRITLPPGPLASAQTLSVTLQNISTNPVVLSEPAVNAPGVETHIKEMASNRTFTAFVEFPQGFEIPPGSAVGVDRQVEQPKNSGGQRADHPSAPPGYAGAARCDPGCGCPAQLAAVAARATRAQVKAVLLEGLLVAVMGAALAFAANRLSPYRLELTRDYSPRTKPDFAVTSGGNQRGGRCRRKDQFARGTPVRAPAGGGPATGRQQPSHAALPRPPARRGLGGFY